MFSDFGRPRNARRGTLEAVINSHKRSFPIEFAGNRQRDTVLLPVRCVFRWIELNSHDIVIAAVNRDVKRIAKAGRKEEIWLWGF